VPAALLLLRPVDNAKCGAYVSRARPMRDQPPTLTATEQPFDVHELFFSATDRKGIITSGNRVFVRVSGYERDELVGRAHNVVRHPDMPRAVFQILWDYLEAGRPIAAYVKNLAKNGNHYWVVATVAPTEDGGYLSVRLKPTAGIREIVEPLYAQVRAHERTLEAERMPRKEVIASSMELLVELVGKAGYSSYDDFMRHILPVELAARDAAVSQIADVGLSGVAADCLRLKRALDRVFAQLDRYSELEQGLDGKAEHLAAMAERARLSALNATISASRLGDDGRVLAAIAMLMRREAGETELAIRAAADIVEPTREATGDVGFDVCLAKIQTEMALFFLDELTRGRGDDDAAQNVRRLLTAAAGSASTLDAKLATARQLIGGLGHAVGAVREKLTMLDALRVGGDVEAAHLADSDRFRVLFAQIREEVDGATADLTHLAKLADHASAASAGRRLEVLADSTLRHAA
jgi:PAS domain S-box-containing protein